jgi:hypothetical protein
VDLRLVVGGILAILFASLNVFTYLNPKANGLTRFIDAQSKLLTFPRGRFSYRTMYLVSGAVAICLGILALMQGIGIINLPVK